MIHTTHTPQTIAGFGLVETLVAIAILLVVIVGPMSIATNASTSTSFANQQVIAYFLAQEGLELAQKGRDDFLLEQFDSAVDDRAWDEFTQDTAPGDFWHCYSAGGCGLEIDTDAVDTLLVTDCDFLSTPEADCQLHHTTDTSKRARYTHQSTVNTDVTDFTRIITMQVTIPNQEVLVTSEVRWRTDNQIAVQSTIATTYLYNVYGR